MINPMKLMQLKPLWTKFQNNHSKFMQFIAAVGRTGMREDSIIEITVTTPEGKSMCSNMRVKADDVELMAALRELALNNQ